MTGTHHQSPGIGKLAFTTVQGFFNQIVYSQIGVHGVLGLRHEVPRRLWAECSKRFVVSLQQPLQLKSGPDYARNARKE
jgi:hypothetical protein